MSIILPNPNRRAWRRGFWLTLALGLGVAAGSLLWGLAPPQRVAAAVLTMGIAAVPGLLRPRLASLPFRAWNKLARVLSRVATAWVTAVCFYIVVPAIGRARSSLRLGSTGHGESLWTPWPHGPASGGESAEGIARADTSPNGWARDFTAWARRSRNPWAWYFMPFLLVLAAFEPPPNVEAPPPGIYTLY
jgi:hypothetical protein